MAKIFGNILVNTILTEAFVLFYTWAESAGYGERYVTIAMMYGSAVVVANAVYVAVCLRKKSTTT